MDKVPIVQGTFLLEKFPGKGGWTYAALPEVKPDKSAPFGWLKVYGTIDSYPLVNYKLMPMGNGKLFLPVKSSIRKKIVKEKGDYVEITLYADDSPMVVPQDILLCLADESEVCLNKFLNYNEGQKKSFVDWIMEAKTTTTKVDRIVKLIKKIETGLKFQDKLKD